MGLSLQFQAVKFRRWVWSMSRKFLINLVLPTDNGKFSTSNTEEQEHTAPLPTMSAVIFLKNVTLQ